MNSKTWMMAALAGAGVSGAVQAQDMSWSLRAGPSIGTYQGEVGIQFTGAVNEGGAVEGDRELAYGLHGGATLGMGRLFADFAIEGTRLEFGGDSEELERTDMAFTLGYRVHDHVSVFGGYRMGMQGEGLFNDDGFEEAGPFAGAGVGGIAAGPLLLGASAAYSFGEAEIPDTFGEFDYGGISLKFSVSPAQAPQHSVQLRYQNFDGDESLRLDADGDGVNDTTFNVELEETYFQLFYVYTFML